MPSCLTAPDLPVAGFSATTFSSEVVSKSRPLKKAKSPADLYRPFGPMTVA